MKTILPLGFVTCAVAAAITTGLLTKSPEKDSSAPLGIKIQSAQGFRSAPLLDAYLAELTESADAETKNRLESPRFRATALLLEDQLLAKSYADQHREELLQAGTVAEEEIQAAYERRREEFKDAEGNTLPYERVRSGLHEELAAERQVSAGRKLISPLYGSMKVERTADGEKDIHLGAIAAIPAETVLATVDGRNLREHEFRTFVDETVPESRRYVAFAKPNARKWMLASYLDVIVLSEAAKRGKLDESASFREEFKGALQALARMPAAEEGTEPPAQAEN